MKFYYVYILRCFDNSFYTGITSNLERRMNEHNAGKYKNAYTHNRRPLKLEFYQDFLDPTQAIYFEKKIKKWSRAKKEALIKGDFDKLPLLSQCRNETHFKNKKE
ncbi:MAG TPA: GIY-YIG nuclease family protein [Salinimicrobium sp.]|nr:GIY-YIG nuclease family protein [Salinimicrobium sp.]